MSRIEGGKGVSLRLDAERRQGLDGKSCSIVKSLEEGCARLRAVKKGRDQARRG
jgi:hypothetical protein